MESKSLVLDKYTWKLAEHIDAWVLSIYFYRDLIFMTAIYNACGVNNLLTATTQTSTKAVSSKFRVHANCVASTQIYY